MNKETIKPAFFPSIKHRRIIQKTNEIETEITKGRKASCTASSCALNEMRKSTGKQHKKNGWIINAFLFLFKLTFMIIEKLLFPHPAKILFCHFVYQ